MSKEIIRDLILIRDEINKKTLHFPTNEDVLYSKIVDIENKLDTMKDRFDDKIPLEITDSSDVNSTYTPVKNKKKRSVIEMLQKTKRLTAYELSILLNMSRTRCCEYLKELQRDGIVKNNLENKKMYYMLR